MSYNIWMTLAGKQREEAPMRGAAYDQDKDRPIVDPTPSAVPAE